MNRRTAKFILPPTLVVTTFLFAGACNESEEYCEDIETAAKCDAQEGCGWNEDAGVCLNVCSEITDEAECMALDACEWDAFADGTSGGENTCHEPFT